MSDDESFYEIQLNTPHLVLAVLGAAVVGVALFYLGVVIGGRQTDPSASAEWQAAAPVDPAADGDDSGEPVEFLEEINTPVAQLPAAENPAAETSAPATEDDAEEHPESAVAASDFQPAQAVVDEPAPVVAESADGLPRPDASLASGWVVQVRSTPDEAAAGELQRSLAAAGFPAFVVSVDVDGQTYYRVRVGRYVSKGDADVIAAEIESRAGIADPWVTQG